MPEKLKQQLQALQEKWNQTSGRQRKVMIGGGLGAAALIFLILFWASRPDFGVLYSDLAPEEAGTVVEYLQSENIEYQLTRGGGTVMVPRRQLYETRIKLAGKGIASGGIKGYELLDEQNTLGQSERYQKLSQKRALEGELARTISSLHTVKRAYVKIVIPEPNLFADERLEPTAAVTLELAGRDYLDRSQIDGITRMVAGSVEGLRPSEVTVIDTYGNILSETIDENTSLGITSSQMKMKGMVDQYYSQRAQRLLDRVLGGDRSVVQVATELNFSQIEKTTESYDPDTQIIRSEERLENNETTQDTTQTARESSIANYEVNRSVEHLLSQVGNITRLSVSLAVDGIWEEDPEGGNELRYIPRSSSELEALTEIVKGAVGFDTERNDQISVRCVPFDRTQEVREAGWMTRWQDALLYSDLLKNALLVAVVIGLFLFLRSALQNTQQVITERLEQEDAVTAAAEDEFALTGTTAGLPVEAIALPEEEKQFRQLQSQVLKFTETNPEDAIRLLRTWYVSTEQS